MNMKKRMRGVVNVPFLVPTYILCWAATWTVLEDHSLIWRPRCCSLCFVQVKASSLRIFNNTFCLSDLDTHSLHPCCGTLLTLIALQLFDNVHHLARSSRQLSCDMCHVHRCCHCRFRCHLCPDFITYVGCWDKNNTKNRCLRNKANPTTSINLIIDSLSSAYSAQIARTFSTFIDFSIAYALNHCSCTAFSFETLPLDSSFSRSLKRFIDCGIALPLTFPRDRVVDGGAPARRPIIRWRWFCRSSARFFNALAFPIRRFLLHMALLFRPKNASKRCTIVFVTAGKKSHKTHHDHLEVWASNCACINKSIALTSILHLDNVCGWSS